MNNMELNKIYNGNCFDLFKQLDDNSVDCVFTSPPYNRKRNDKYKYYDDAVTDYFQMLCTLVEESLRVSNQLFLNIQATYYNSEDVYGLFGQYKSMIQNVFIWEKLNPMPAQGNNITNAFEYIICIGRNLLKSNSTYTKNVIQTSVYSEMPKEHKAVMHPKISDYFIEHFTKPGDIVLDLFMGLGTTAISCIKFHRNYIGFEISKDYCRLANERIDKETSQQIIS